MSTHGLDRLAECICTIRSVEIDVDEQLDLVAELLAAAPLAAADSGEITEAVA